MLIVEDEVLIALNLEDLLAREGYRTAIAGSAAEVGEVLMFDPPAVALVDMHLRDGLTGPEIAHRLHDLRIPVIVHSGETSVDLARLPAVACLTKPAAPYSLLAQIRQAIRSNLQ